jgi:AcrR family transcriptional regulator
VDKEQKRRDIALSCRDLLLEEGIETLTVSQIARTAGVGKGTIYEYFANKEDIVFEIITSFIDEYHKELAALIEASMPTREKLFTIFYTLYGSPQGQKHLEIYKEFLAISLTRKEPEMLHFGAQTRAKFLSIVDAILKQGVQNDELEARFADAGESLMIFNSGLVLDSRLENFDVRMRLEQLLDILFGKKEG